MNKRLPSFASLLIASTVGGMFSLFVENFSMDAALLSSETLRKGRVLDCPFPNDMSTAKGCFWPLTLREGDSRCCDGVVFIGGGSICLGAETFLAVATEEVRDLIFLIVTGAEGVVESWAARALRFNFISISDGGSRPGGGAICESFRFFMVGFCGEIVMGLMVSKSQSSSSFTADMSRLISY